jgi:acetyl esterase/lipase
VAAHPPVDPEVAAALAALDAPPLRTIEDINRRRLEPAPDRELLRRGGAILVEDRTIPGPDGAPDLEISVLTPATGPTGPAVYYIHGGGMVLGSRLSVDVSFLDAVAERGFVLVSADYRLAPEHPYPAGLVDCYAGLVWTADHAGELGFDPARLAIAGSSAGGGLAAGTALMARDRGGPRLTHQMLLCPMLDDREITPSSTELDGDAPWDRHANRLGWTSLLGEACGGPDVPIYAAPARATDLVGLPPTFIDVGDVETFRDEDIDYAARLARAGVPVELHVWPGGVHGFTTSAPDAAVSRRARVARREYLAGIAERVRAHPTR